MAQPAPAASAPPPAPGGIAAAARLSSIRQALRTADMIAGKPADSLAAPVAITEVCPHLTASHRHCLPLRTEQAASAAPDGLEPWSAGPISPAAAERLRRELRNSLAQVERLFAAR